MLLISILLASSLPPLAYHWFGAEKQWLAVTLILAWLGFFSQSVYHFSLKRSLLRANQTHQFSFKALLRIEHTTEKKNYCWFIGSAH